MVSIFLRKTFLFGGVLLLALAMFCRESTILARILLDLVLFDAGVSSKALIPPVTHKHCFHC